MLKRYRQFRSYGHGRLVAATLAPDPFVWYGGIIVLFNLGLVVIDYFAPVFP